MTPLFLRISRNGALVGIKQFPAGQITIGTDPSVNLPLQGSNISAIHFMVENRGTQYFVVDLGSETGTRVNNQNVAEQLLANGDVITVGEYTLEFSEGIPKARAATESTAALAFVDTIKPVQNNPPAVPVIPAVPPAPPKQNSVVVQATPPPAAPKPSAPFVVPLAPPKSIPLAQTVPPVKSPIAPPPVLKAPPAPPAPKQAPAPVVVASVPPVARAALETVSAAVPFPVAIPAISNISFKGRHLKEVVKPSKGTTIEVVVGWADRVLNTYHFNEKGVIKVGSHPKNDIILPMVGGPGDSLPLIKVDELAQIYIPMNVDGELTRVGSTARLQDLMIQGKITRSKDGAVYQLQQDELIRLDFESSISVYIRYVGATPKAMMLPWLDLTTGQLLSILVTGALMFFGAALIQLTSTDSADQEQKVEEPVRKVTFKIPEHMKRAELAEKTQDASPTQAQAPNPVKDQMKVVKGSPIDGPPSPPAEARPNNSKSADKKLTAANVGKTGSLQVVSQKKQTGASSNAPKKPEVNVKNFGILKTFGGSGTQNQIDKAVAGAEAVGGLGRGAGGAAGSGIGDSNGTDPGLRSVGAGGKGTATIGVAGVKTNGRGGGTLGYGEGDLGGKKSSKIVAGGAEESFAGTMDKEGIRRVVRANQGQLKACYERALNRDPSLSGKIVITWDIGPGGVVTVASIKSSSLENAEVENCCISRLKSWRFPDPPKNTVATISFPFIFNRD